MADSDTALAALNQARQWVLENVDFDVSNVEVDGEWLVVDFTVTGPGGKVWFDDRNRILKPRLRTPDGTFTATTEYQRPNGETLYLSQEQFNALTRAQQRALTPTGNTGQRANFTFAPRIAILRDLLHTAKIATQNWTVPHVMRDADGNLLGDTLTVFSQNDGAIRSSNANIATARSGSGLSLDVSGDLAVDAGVSGGTFAFSMAFLSFDTSPLGASATITGAVVSLAGTGSNETSTNNPTVQIKFKDYGTGDPTTADWFNITTTGWTGLTDVGSKALNTWDGTAAAYNAFSDAGNYGSYSLTGTTRMVVGNSLFPTGTPTGGNSFFFQSSDEAGTTSDPKLVITYTAVVNASITGVTATATGTGNAGAVAAQVKATVTGVTGSASAAGNAGAVTAVRIANITGFTATASAAGVAGAVAAHVQTTITGVTATATADGIAGSPNTGLTANITGTTAEASATGVAGAVSTVRVVNISGETATAPAAGVAGSVTAGVQVAITGVTSTATATGNAGAVTAQVQASIAGVSASAAASGVPGALATVRIASVTGATGSATATGIAGAVVVRGIIAGVTATAVADGIAGSVLSIALQLSIVRGVAYDIGTLRGRAMDQVTVALTAAEDALSAVGVGHDVDTLHQVAQDAFIATGEAQDA